MWWFPVVSAAGFRPLRSPLDVLRRNQDIEHRAVQQPFWLVVICMGTTTLLLGRKCVGRGEERRRISRTHLTPGGRTLSRGGEAKLWRRMSLCVSPSADLNFCFHYFPSLPAAGVLIDWSLMLMLWNFSRMVTSIQRLPPCLSFVACGYIIHTYASMYWWFLHARSNCWSQHNEAATGQVMQTNVTNKM